MTTGNQSLPPLPGTSNYTHANGVIQVAFTSGEMREYATRYGDARAAHARQEVLVEWADHMTRMNNAIKELK